MKIKIGLYHYILAGLFLLVLSLLINFLPILQFIIGLLFVLLLSIAYGQIISEQVPLIYKLLIGLTTVLALVIIIGALLIYLLTLTNLSIGALWLFIFLLPIIYWRKQPVIFKISFKKPGGEITQTILPALFIIITGILFFFYYQASTTAVIFSPWSILSDYWIYFYLALGICLIACISKAKSNSWLIWTSIFIFASTALGATLYKLGYGFDFHIHNATTLYIWETGTITPKPLYYIGYYSLIINLKWLFSLSLQFLNQWLVPIIFSLSIPSFIYFAFNASFDFKKIIFRYLPLGLLLLPYSLFTFSTPQSLANTLFIILVVSTLPYLFKKELNIVYLWLLAISISFIHPITGVPAILLILFISMRQWRRSNYVIGKQRQLFFTVIVIFGALILPVLFFINSYLNNNTISWQLPHLNLSLPSYNSFVSIYDFAYNFSWLLPLLVLALVISAIIYIIRMKRLIQFSEYAIVLLILILNYIWLRYFISFDWLIDYERLNYANRLLDLIFIISLPFFFIALGMLINKILQQKLIIILWVIILVAIILTTNFYLSYPRRDPYMHNKSINSSATDFNIVKTIAESEDDFVVLANQAVSAAALSEFGFQKYFNGNIFYYPIPTSGQLYQLYLDAVYQKKPINQIIERVKKITQTDNLYLVINNYWLNSTNLINSHKKTANSWQQIDNKAFIFYYNLADNISQ